MTSTKASGSTPNTGEESGALLIDGISYIPSSVLLSGIPKLSFKDNRAFGVVDQRGDCPRIYSSASELGFYFNDTRYLSIWELKINGSTPIALAQELRHDGNTLIISMTNRDLTRVRGTERIPRDTFLIRRTLSLFQDTLYEVIGIKNFDSVPHHLRIEQWCGTRFLDIFEVRGYTREMRGSYRQPIEKRTDSTNSTLFQYDGLDALTRSCEVLRVYPAETLHLAANLAGHATEIDIPAKGDFELKSIISFDKISDGTIKSRAFQGVSTQDFMRIISVPGIPSFFDGLSIETDNAIVNRAIRNAQLDIGMLLTQETDTLVYPYAGIPWFSAPFGRDGLITAYQLLPWCPKVAKDVLNFAFSILGSKVDDFTDEQPGKVFHELRHGEMANTREIPYIPYYGSVDSTPLSLILLHEYISWTKDLASLREWWPYALRALEWIEKWGDRDGDGFQEYIKQSPTGLVNQGWKDSHDSIMHKDGTLASAPIRLCEAQGYAFRAKMGMSSLAKMLGEDELSGKLRIEALQLKSQFSDRFWNPSRGSVYLALDHLSLPCDVLSSNMGHCLWSGILQPEQSSAVAEHLMSESMFSGYGVRTLADTEASYNPMSYHNGSIWPHDNSIIMEGFRNYGLKSELSRLSLGMLSVLEASNDFRLPELFCGFRRRGNEPPVPYEVACKPQAWAAGSVFLMLKSMLGLSINSAQNYVVFDSPLLTSKISQIAIKGLKGANWEIDVILRSSNHDTQVEVTRKSGDIRVLTVK